MTSVRVVEPSPGLFGVSLTFSDAAAARLASGTAAHLGRPIAIVLDGIVIRAVTVRGPVSDNAVITGVTADSARQLADRLAPAAGTQDSTRTEMTLPVPLTRVKAEYTPAAMAAKIQGTVVLEAVVLPDGSVGKVTVVRSLDAFDAAYGLDQQAIDSVSQWTWKPGTRDGKPVAVAVAIEVHFILK